MTTITKAVDVDVPISTAYNQWTQFESFPEFMGGVDKIEQLNERSQVWHVNVAGVKRQFDAEITEQHPEERVAWRSVDGTTHAGVVTFHKLADDKTRVTVQLDWEPDGVLEKTASAVNVDDRQVTGDLDRFKSFIESRGSATGAWRGTVPREG
ncbi:MAG TPA: SRPBCC family protein [Jatrophihabitans sp.]|jgi:uncharacterized membrane protein